MEIAGFDLEELHRLIELRAEVDRLLQQRRHDRPRRIMTWLKWRRRAELRRQSGVVSRHGVEDLRE
ncbi:hypothetical protein JQ582_37220 [Bradyrhizobium japonicum]|jgi:hypothetical protein|uniref:hypothetical protein n=1 Tax=Bradyrhizobium TaxID=374 RepID=UPI001BA4C8C1|nr:hypothetical protein [Bradyrhizobium japonicum]MBR0734843.1 hypothetical protein [Bradyrhizobium japonicum]MBR0749577.1 hypothetical protein [Bradyrhizobium japonicum]MBR0808441.1 hypothetical protein [Bradyrhizobium japonicum]